MSRFTPSSFAKIGRTLSSHIPLTAGLLLVLLLIAACTASLFSSEPAPDTSASPTPEYVPSDSSPAIEPVTNVETVATAPAPTPAPPPIPETTPAPLLVAISANVPPEIRQPLEGALAKLADNVDNRPVEMSGVISDAVNVIHFMPKPESGDLALAQRVYAVVAPFDTIRDDVSLDELQATWSSQEGAPLFITEEAAVSLGPVFGSLPTHIVAETDLLTQLQQHEGSLGILAFDKLEPIYKVLTIDGSNPLSNQLEVDTYPLTVTLAISGPEAGQLLTPLTGVVPRTNRDPQRLTTLVMTGVTAMSRGTAEKMEEKGYLYPTLVISDTLSAADITHISNEVPFIKGCKVNNTYMNLILCSDYPYWQALEAIGTDIVGLSGNHVNDFGREGAIESLGFYEDNGIPVYGSGLTEDEACKPLMWEHNGNTFAFIAALAWWPEEAFATESEPGACYLYNNYEDILAMVRKLSDEVDIVAVELQFWETYDPWPIKEQVVEFRELRAAGADIVTGVQSHVPQAMEPYGSDESGSAGIIVYGLGNLFFDQMESWETRTGLIARHTLYDGRVLNTEILTTVLEDFAQPRWATPEERAGILKSIFDAAPAPGEFPPEPTPSPAPPPLIQNDRQDSGESPDPVNRSESPEASSPADNTASASEPATPSDSDETPVNYSTSAYPSIAWPIPIPEPQDHYWLASPLSAEYNQIPAATYAFGSTANGTYRIHHGSDIANSMNTPLLAPDSAVVVYAGPDNEANVLGPYPGFYGNVILFQLDRTWRDQPVYVLFGHMQDVLVSSGQHVERGQMVGGVGMTGIAIGPHVHVEVRLGGTGYNNAYNADLWLEPPYGYGTIAGQVVTPDGRAWHDIRLHLYRLGDDGSRLFRIIPTYAEDPGLNPDPERAENFVFANIPAGEYQLVLRYGGKNLRQRLSVNPGQTTPAQFVLAE